MTREAMEAAVRGYFEAVGRGDREQLHALFSPDMRWRVPQGAIAPYAGTHEGADTIIDLMLTAVGGAFVPEFFPRWNPFSPELGLLSSIGVAFGHGEPFTPSLALAFSPNLGLRFRATDALTLRTGISLRFTSLNSWEGLRRKGLNAEDASFSQPVVSFGATYSF